MARSRNIKPSFFDNDELAELDPLARILFIGLWTIADYKGDLEWREKRIKKQLLAYDDCDIKKLAINLDKSGFIRFYSDGEKIYINVCNFDKHQNPHKNERQKGSEIPSYSDSMRQLVDFKDITINRDKNGITPDKNETNPADSFNLIPDSLNPNKKIDAISQAKQRDPVFTDKAFEVFWENWRAQKHRIGIKNYGSRKAARAKFDKLFKNKTAEQLETIINNSLTKLVEIVDDLHVHSNESQYFNFRNMYPQKFLGDWDWENVDD